MAARDVRQATDTLQPCCNRTPAAALKAAHIPCTAPPNIVPLAWMAVILPRCVTVFCEMVMYAAARAGFAACTASRQPGWEGTPLRV